MRHLFPSIHLRAIADAALERRQGRVVVDDERSPSVARISLGTYEMFGGDPSHPRAEELIATAARPSELFYGNDPRWRRRILDVHGERVEDRPTLTFTPHHVTVAGLAAVEARRPSELTLRRLDTDLASQLDDELVPHALRAFGDVVAFCAAGIGLGVVDGGGRLVSAATSYAISSRSLEIEIAIATRPAHRGRGLAAVAAAALVRWSLEHGLTPCWTAANPISQRMAVRLGFVPAGECEVLWLS